MHKCILMQKCTYHAKAVEIRGCEVSEMNQECIFALFIHLAFYYQYIFESLEQLKCLKLSDFSDDFAYWHGNCDID